MLAQLLALARWEWFKIRHRWLPWILLVVAILITQALLWGFYAAFRLFLRRDIAGAKGS